MDTVKHILLVEDEPLVAQMMAEMLRAEGYRVDVAANGRLALEKLEGQTYDLIVSDLRMPELDGLGLYRELERRWPGLLRRVIIVTGTSDVPEYAEFLAHAAVPVLSKPFDVRDLYHVARQVLALS
jgi:DNA-binding response OmpR family regulator